MTLIFHIGPQMEQQQMGDKMKEMKSVIDEVNKQFKDPVRRIFSNIFA